MKFILYLDESGDHGLTQIDQNFPVFVLCGVIFREDGYNEFRIATNKIKEKFWGKKTVIFHSRDIRKCEKEFQILFDTDVKAEFYTDLNSLIENSRYKIVAAGVNKEAHIKRYGKLANDPYEISLSFVIERAIFLLDEVKDESKELKIVIEKRGKKEDNNLASHFSKIKALGTYYVDRERMSQYKIEIEFKDKKENINGLQLSDLVAYPIARYIIDRKRANPAFDILKNKFYMKFGNRYGLKIFP